MFYDIFMAAVLVAMIVSEWRVYKKRMEELADFKRLYKNWQVENMPKWFIYLTYAVAVVALGMGIAILIKPTLLQDEENYLLYAIFAIGISIFFIISTYHSTITDALYYTNDGFEHEGRMVTFSNVKQLRLKTKILSKREIVTFNGETFDVNQFAAKKIEQLISERKNNKLEKKK